MTQDHHYWAFDRAGNRVAGRMQANSREDAAAQLHASGLYPIRVCDAAGTRGRWTLPTLLQSAIPISALLAVTREIATLLGAQITIDRALPIIVERCADTGLRTALDQANQALRKGRSFAEALERQPAAFSPLYLALVRTGESAGQLDAAMMQLVAFLEQAHSMRSKLKSALTYPAILLAAGMVATLVISKVVFPEFKPLLEESGSDLPAFTTLVMSGSQALSVSLPTVIICTLGAYVGSCSFHGKDTTDAWLHGAALRVPRLGDVWRSIDTAQFSHAIALLLAGGLPLPEALQLSLPVLSNKRIQRGAAVAVAYVREGQPLSDAMARAEVLPTEWTSLIRIGEETGHTAEILLNQGVFFADAANIKLANTISILVPALTLMVGCLVGMLMAAVMLAVLQLDHISS